MNEDYLEYVMKRCDKALMEDATYMEMEQSGKYSEDELRVKAEVLCYLRCMKDERELRNM